MPLFHQRINPRMVLGPLFLESLRKKSEKMGGENGILTQVWDQAQMVLRKPLMSSDKSRSFPDYEAIKLSL